jgi:protein required for attachment to host cells
MRELKIDKGGWIVVCDGAKALVLENAGGRMQPSLRTRKVFDHPDAKTRELGTDKPGRSFNSVGMRRSAMEQVDWHKQEEDRFLKGLAEHLDKAVLAGEAKALIVVAPSRALGVLRSCFTEHVRQAIEAEVEKDLVKTPVREIEQQLLW